MTNLFNLRGLGASSFNIWTSNMCLSPRNRSAGIAQEELGLSLVELATAGNFDRDRSIQFRVAGFPDAAELPNANTIEYFEMAQALRTGWEM